MARQGDNKELLDQVLTTKQQEKVTIKNVYAKKISGNSKTVK